MHSASKNDMNFQIIALTPPGSHDPSIAIAAGRAGCLGILDLEYCEDAKTALQAMQKLSRHARNGCGIKLNGQDDGFIRALSGDIPSNISFVILTMPTPENLHAYAELFHAQNRRVLLEVTSLSVASGASKAGVDGLIAKGHESGGFVGEKTAFILLQQIILKKKLPVYVQGGIGLHTAAACYAAGAAGIVLDSQLFLTRESPLPDDVKRHISRMNGSEPRLYAENTEAVCRIYIRPGSPCAEELKKEPSCNLDETGRKPVMRQLIRKQLRWDDTKNPFWLLGQDVGITASLSKKYQSVGSVLQAFKRTVNEHIESAKKAGMLQKGSPLAQSHGTKYPIVQGPMARITDCAAFASCVAKEGALPFLALAKLRGTEITKLLQSVKDVIGNSSWGVGILGFNENELLSEQIEALSSFSPPFAILAGALPGQVSLLESRGITTYAHIASPDILEMFLAAGAKRFIIEGSECGGHIGPRSSFVLWDTMTEKLLQSLKISAHPDEYHILYAGGIHDALSASMTGAISAPLAAAGVRIGVLMGTAYLLTPEIVESGAIVAGYQQKVLECRETSVLEFSPGHALRCCVTPLSRRFEGKKRELSGQNVAGKELSAILGQLILGKSRIAAKGLVRKVHEKQSASKSPLVSVDCTMQHEEGLYMVGQAAALHDRVRTISHLHEDVTVKASNKLAALTPYQPASEQAEAKPCDVAIIGMACLLPKAGDLRTYWENILCKKNAITEVPIERWDWRLYFDEDRNAKDKIYSKWGGFLDELLFDPTRYGMPPKSIESIDPMQLMALEVARRTLADAGYEDREFDRETASVILGASGGGDVGMQYALRSELPRFLGELPDEVAKRLPEWSEDTFAGLLLNVITGRIANRLNLGGVNFTTDAACASSLAAIYQAVGELVSGRSSMVIAGGVDTGQGPFGYMCFSKTQALSPRGRSSALDSGADGIVISEGVAMVAMKRLEDAERDGDRIYAVIKGVGGGSDGKAKGLTAPLPAGQLRAMRRAYEQAGFGPDTVGLFEAHGTGTVVGDSAELESTSSLLREAGCKPRHAAIGSVKTLIGHTKAAAGVAGLIKSTLALYHRTLPPHGGVDRPNQVLEQPDSPLYLTDQPLPWLGSEDQPRRAAVSAFGFGGTNFHVVLEEHVAGQTSSVNAGWGRTWPAELLLWHGSNREELKERIVRAQEEIDNKNTSGLYEIAFNLAKAYRAGAETIAIVAADAADASQKMMSAAGFLTGKIANLPVGVYYGGPAQPEAKTAVLFPGQGSQYTGMSLELALNFPAYSDALSEADRILLEPFEHRFGKGTRLSHFIFPRGCYTDHAKADAMKALTGTDVAQPALGAISAGLWRLLQWFGLRADMAGGHSYGEFTALFAGGVIDFDALMSLSEARGRIIVNTLKGNGREFGTMAAVRASRQYVEKIISDIDGVVIANHNAPEQCVISGSTSGIESAAARISEDKMSVVKIPVAAAFHSRFMEPAQARFSEVLGKTLWRNASFPVYSNTTGKRHADDIPKLMRVMTDHLVRPVEFVAEIEAMYRDGARVFLELGPKAVLTKLIGATLGGRPHTVVALDGNGGGLSGMLHAFGQLLCAGVRLDIDRLFEGREHANISGSQKMQLMEQNHKTAWLLKGSRARRATEQVKQVGITMDELRSRKTSLQIKDLQIPSGPETNHLFKLRLASRKQSTRKFNEGGYRKMPNDYEPSMMAAYLDMMKQFLESQERIMSLHLTGTTNGRSADLRMPRHEPSQASVRNSATRRSQPFLKNTLPFKPEIPAFMTDENIGHAETDVQRSDLPKTEPVPPPSQGKVSAEPESTPTERMDRETLNKMLLGIIEEKTGYPPDMIGVNQDLEADLGIDSIKRVEIVGALMKALPQSYGKALGKDLGGLNTQPTLGSVLDILDKVGVKASAGSDRPFDHAEVRSATPGTSHSFRHIIEPTQEPIPTDASRSLCPGRFIITRDALGVADRLYELLCGRNCTASIVDKELLKDENLLKQWCLSLNADIGAIAGIVHLTQIGSDRIGSDAPVQEWRNTLQLNEKSLFILLHELTGKLHENAHILSASSLGGLFSRDANKLPLTPPSPLTSEEKGDGLTLQGGDVGLLKSLSREREGLHIKAVDVDPGQTADEIASCLMSELELEGGRREVGYPRGERTIFRTVGEPFSSSSTLERKKKKLPIENDMVILATGGSKGVTAELLRELALPGNTLILTGRSELQEHDQEDLKSFKTSSALQEHFVSEVRSGRVQLSPADIRRKVKSVLAAREMRNNIDDFRKRGARVEYHAVDVTDDDAMRELFDGVYEKYKRISGVIHGAGIIEDKLLADKKSDSWSRVVETKVLGLLLLQKYLMRKHLKFFAVMSSVAGRYGNSGQSDYATANELMNRLCCQLNRNWDYKVTVKALCWGPWGKTTFGPGMVTPEMEAKFAQQNVSLVSSEAGRSLLRNELTQKTGNVEIVCGEGPWEQNEAALGRIERRSMPDEGSVLWPLLENSKVTAIPNGKRGIAIYLGKNHSYLNEHCIDQIPVLPAAAALEIMSEAASHFWPGWKVVEARDCRLLKGIELSEQNHALNLVISQPEYGADGGFELTAGIQSGPDNGPQRLHYRSVLRLERTFPETFKYHPKAHAEKNLTVAKAYNEWLFHGPRFQVIEDILGLSMRGVRALVRTTSPSDWMLNIKPGSQPWIFDPAIVDAAAQMALIWGRAYRNESALPARFGRVTRYSAVFPDKVNMHFEQISEASHLICANIFFSDADGNVVLRIEDMECVSSPGLNRLGGTSKYVRLQSGVINKESTTLLSRMHS